MYNIKVALKFLKRTYFFNGTQIFFFYNYVNLKRLYKCLDLKSVDVVKKTEIKQEQR